MKNKSIILGIFAALLLIGSAIAGVIIYNQENNQALSKEEMLNYFAETISAKFVSSIGQPIEGIAPPMFLELFPNLREQDLNGVQTALGYYKYENGQLVYKPVGPQTHSAAQMITEEGYETLLDNLSNRFNIELKNKDSVDRIIDNLYEESSSSEELDFTTYRISEYNPIKMRKQVVARTAPEWNLLWNEMYPSYDIEAPQFNFNNKMLIAVFQGEKPTGGYKIEITKIIERENEIAVYVEETSPGINCAADTVLTSPYHIVEVKKSDKLVRFIFEQEIIECN